MLLNRESPNQMDNPVLNLLEIVVNAKRLEVDANQIMLKL